MHTVKLHLTLLKERKFFDSGDYALYKAGKGTSNAVGSEHPSPDMIPHSNPAASSNNAATNHVEHHTHLDKSITTTKTSAVGGGGGESASSATTKS